VLLAQAVAQAVALVALLRVRLREPAPLQQLLMMG